MGKVEKKGIVMVYTGDGKGKTTAAIGMAVRSIAYGKKVCFLQFLKSKDAASGERDFFSSQQGIDFYTLGIGFSWEKKTAEQLKAHEEAWEFAKKKIADPSYDLVILDEINCLLAVKEFPIEEVMPLQEVIEAIKRRPIHQHIVCTGRYAKPEIILLADLVSEVKNIKHHFSEGMECIKGIEY